MGLYRAFNPRFWTDNDVEDCLNSEERYVYLYLITNPTANLCGCYQLSLRRMAYETALDSAEKVKNILLSLEQKGFIKFNLENSEILMLHWAKNNWTSSEKLDKPIFEEILKIKTREFKEIVYKIFSKRESVLKNNKYGMDTLSIQVQKNTVSVTDKENIRDIENRDCQEEREEELKTKNSLVLEKFEQFWRAYPKKEGKGKCLDWFKRKNPSLKLFEQIMKAIEIQKCSEKWKKDNGQFIPMPFTWLNQSRWEDSLGSEVNYQETDHCFQKRKNEIEEDKYWQTHPDEAQEYLKTGEISDGYLDCALKEL